MVLSTILYINCLPLCVDILGYVKLSVSKKSGEVMLAFLYRVILNEGAHIQLCFMFCINHLYSIWAGASFRLGFLFVPFSHSFPRPILNKGNPTR